MGNFYCIPESCAKVVWREYLPARVRYRYREEDLWQYINGNGASAEELPGQCPTNYVIAGTFRRGTSDYLYKWWSRAGNLGWLGPLSGVRVEHQEEGSAYVVYATNSNGQELTSLIYSIDDDDYKNDNYPSQSGFIYLRHSTTSIRSDRGHDVTIQKFVPTNKSNDNCACIFKVFQDGKLVFDRVESICPEYEILPCTLSDEYKEIKIEKFPYLSAIQVLNYALDAEAITGVPYPLPTVNAIPQECLNIYRIELFDVLPEGGKDTLDDPVFGDFIKQICSSPNCPPPEYQVICNCNDCESCPPETCPVECGEHICCYNDLGVSVKQIDINNYCG